MLDTEFGGIAKSDRDFDPQDLREVIDSTIDAIYQPINNGVYRAGFATSQSAYEELETPVVDPLTITRVSGVDVGMRYLAVETDLKNESKFYSGKSARHKVNRYFKARKTLQRKGTRSAKRRLIALSGRERRLIADVNHQISKEIAA
jgi:transposase